MYILTCIPAYNEENVIANVIKESLRYSDTVVVCDDGSSDNTAKMAEIAGAYVIKHPTNLGKGAALKSLFKYAKYSNSDIIVTIDGDGQFSPSEIPKLIKPIEDKKSDIVIGYRFEHDTEIPSYRKLGNKILDKMSSAASEFPLRDTQSGFRSYSKNALTQIDFTNDGFTADSEILINATKKQLKITEVKVEVKYNTGFKTSTQNPVSHGVSVFVSLIDLVLIRHPLKYLGIPGIVILVLGTLVFSYVFSLFNETRYFSIPFTLITLGLIILGLMLILVSGLLFAITRTYNKN